MNADSGGSQARVLTRLGDHWAQTILWCLILAGLGARGLRLGAALLLMPWGAAAFLLARRCGYPAWVGWPVALSGFLALQYLAVTSPSVRQHDVDGHRQYIDILTSTGKLPAVQQGWETWQPPLYYALATVWREMLPPRPDEDPFRAIQFLSAALYIAAITAALLMFRCLRLNATEAVAALTSLAVVPGNVFFAGRINNDVLLPLLGAGVMFTTAEFVRSGERRWLWWLAGILPLTLATKGSSLAIMGGALLMVAWTEFIRGGWRQAVLRSWTAALPSACWLLYWWCRNVVQTGNPLYVNAALPDELRILEPWWHRLFSFDVNAYLAGRYYYDPEMRRSFPTALVTSVLHGEYGMNEYGFRWTEPLRWGCLGVLLVGVAGMLVRPRQELRPMWTTCLCLAFCQSAITVTYALQFPYACNQNMRFFAQAFVPFAGLFGLGFSNFLGSAGWVGKLALAAISGAFLVGLTEYYAHMLF